MTDKEIIEGLRERVKELEIEVAYLENERDQLNEVIAKGQSMYKHPFLPPQYVM